jgi:FAD-dependent urate hydroxylase
MDFDVTIVGAGPFGLSGAAYLKDKGVGVGIFGDPMSFWQNHMPAGMYLRSNWAASHISDPHKKLTLDHFKADTRMEFANPTPLQRFVEYGQWYQQKAVPDLQRQQVTGVEKNGNGFQLSLSDGQIVKSRRVIIATGIAPFPWMSKEFDGLPTSHVTHSSDHKDLSRFTGQQVLVVGGGQSALDAARLLHAHGAMPELSPSRKRCAGLARTCGCTSLACFPGVCIRILTLARRASAGWWDFQTCSVICRAVCRTGSAIVRYGRPARAGKNRI